VQSRSISTTAPGGGPGTGEAVDVGPGGGLLLGLGSGDADVVDTACPPPRVVLDPADPVGCEIIVAGARVVVEASDPSVVTGVDSSTVAGVADVVSDELPLLHPATVSVSEAANAANILTVTRSSMSGVGGLVASPSKQLVIRHQRDGNVHEST
jgi:hypothetical protein